MKIRRVASLWITVAFALALAGCFGLGAQLGLVGTLAVDSEPTGAVIYLNGEDTGKTTPHVFTGLRPGNYEVRLVKDGYPYQTHHANVVRREQTTLSADLIGDSGWITGRVMPERGATTGVADAVVSTPYSQTVTDEDGYFKLYAPAGTFDVVAIKEGRAIGKTQDVTVVENQESPEVFVYVWELFDEDEEAKPVSIRVSGLSPGDVVVGTREITIDVDAAYPIVSLKVRVGHRDRPAELDEYGVSQVTFTLDPDKYSYGAEYLYIVAYDFQNNGAELEIPFTFAPADHGPAFDPSIQPQLEVQSLTLGIPLRLMTDDLPDARNLPDHVSRWVRLMWNPVEGASGYSIYRSTNLDGPYVKVADFYHHESRLQDDGRFWYQDFDGSLTFGKPFYYKVEPYDRTKERGAMSEPVKAVLLEPFSVFLKSPANGAVVKQNQFVFSWEKTDIHVPADVQSLTFQYLFAVKAITVPIEMDTTVINQQQLMPPPLDAGLEYVWDVGPAQAFAVIAPNSTSVTRSYYDSSVNGRFTFFITTDQ